jgi:hypothetical protein
LPSFLLTATPRSSISNASKEDRSKDQQEKGQQKLQQQATTSISDHANNDGASRALEGTSSNMSGFERCTPSFRAIITLFINVTKMPTIS